MNGPSIPIPPPPPNFPRGAHVGPAPEIIQLNNDFAKMNVTPTPTFHANHNPASSAKPINSAPKLDGLPPLNGRPPVTYEGFTFRKAEPEMFGQKQTWGRANRVPLPVGQGALLDQVKRQQQRKKIVDQLTGLDKPKRRHIDLLIEEKRREEKDPRFEWNVAAVKLETKNVGRRGIETSSMQVILSRKLRATVAITSGQGGGKGGAGKVIDLDAPKTSTHKEHPQPKGHAEQGPIFMQPGMGAPAGPKGAAGGQFGPSPFHPQHQGQHPGLRPLNGAQMRQGHPEVVVVPEHSGFAPSRGPPMQAHPDIIVMPDRPPSRPAPQMGHAFAQHLPHMMQPHPQQPPHQQPHHHHQQAANPPHGAQARPGHPEVVVVPEHPGFAPSRGPQMQQPHQQLPHHHHQQASKPYKPEKKPSMPQVANQRSHKGVEKWLEQSEDDESYDSGFSSDGDDLSVLTPDSSLASDSRRKRDSPRRGSLHKHHRRHSEDEDRRRPVVREHHRKTYSDPPRSRGSRYHRDAYDIYTEDSHSHRPVPIRRQSIACGPEMARPRLSRPLTYRPDDYDDYAGFTETLRPGLPRALTYQYGRPDERRNMMGSRFPIDEPMPSIRETRGLDYAPVRRVSAMPFAPEPFADSGRERMNDRMYQQELEDREYEQEMKRKEYIGLMRRSSGVGYPRMDRYGYPSL